MIAPPLENRAIDHAFLPACTKDNGNVVLSKRRRRRSARAYLEQKSHFVRDLTASAGAIELFECMGHTQIIIIFFSVVSFDQMRARARPSSFASFVFVFQKRARSQTLPTGARNSRGQVGHDDDDHHQHQHQRFECFALSNLLIVAQTTKFEGQSKACNLNQQHAHVKKLSHTMCIADCINARAKLTRLTSDECAICFSLFIYILLPPKFTLTLNAGSQIALGY